MYYEWMLRLLHVIIIIIIIISIVMKQASGIK